LEVSEIGFGGWQLGSSAQWGDMRDRDAIALVHAALDNGVNLFDTAPNYAATRSETLLGRALEGQRHRAVVVSKFGHRPGSDETDFSVQHFWDSLHESLRRLRTDYLDVYLAHSPPIALLAPEEALWEAMVQARAAGKIRCYGASVDRAAELEAAAGIPGVAVLEVLFNALQQDARRAFPVAEQRGLGLIAKVPLDSGWLGGRYDGGSRFAGVRGRWSETDIGRRADAVARLREILPPSPALPAQALAFILSYAQISSVIPGTRSRSQLAANCSAAGSTLTADLRLRVEALWDDITGGGAHPLPW
jgi:aryl-alcohol dehydrogenase-like predicted oxidoreductase